MASPNIVWIDSNGGGHGWSIDTTSTNSLATDAPGRMDLLSVVTHEFAHVLGFDHDLLGITLSVGERRLPVFSFQIHYFDGPLDDLTDSRSSARAGSRHLHARDRIFELLTRKTDRWERITKGLTTEDELDARDVTRRIVNPGGRYHFAPIGSESEDGKEPVLDEELLDELASAVLAS